MTINIFEGTRRIVRIIAVLSIIGYCAGVWFDEPYITRKFIVSNFGSPPTQIKTETNECSSDDQINYKHLITNKGNAVSIDICFRSSIASNGQKMIPYKLTDDGKHVWLGHKYSNEVENYISTVANQFKLTREDEEIADKEFLSKKLQDAWEYFLGLIAWLVGLFAVSNATGWIVRGFLGIPSGQDFKS